jgi:hypothetical protein
MFRIGASATKETCGLARSIRDWPWSAAHTADSHASETAVIEQPLAPRQSLNYLHRLPIVLVSSALPLHLAVAWAPLAVDVF